MKRIRSLKHALFVCLFSASFFPFSHAQQQFDISQDTFTINMVTFRNDITSLHQLESEQIIKDLARLINTCKIFVNGQLIKQGYLVKVPVIGNKCTITIVGRLDYFHPIFDLHPLIRLAGRFIQSHLIFYYEIHPEDLIVHDNQEACIDISNVIIDLVDKYDLWQGNNGTARYQTEFDPTACSAKITIIDP